MVWVRLDDRFDEHPKVAQLSDSAVALFVAGLAYCNRNLTDGFIPHQVGLGQLRYCGGNAVPAIRELERVGLWQETQGGWHVHDYAKYQPSRDDVERDRANTRERVKRHRNGTSNGVTNDGETAHPVPVPDPEGGGTSESGEGDTGGSGGTRRKRRSPSIPLPDDWQPNDRHRQKAASLGVDTDGEAAAFRDHVLAHDKRYADWDRAFHTWLTNTRKFGANAPLNGTTPTTGPRAVSTFTGDESFGGPKR